MPGVSTRFSLSVENEQANAGRDCQTRLARPNSQARTGTEKYSFSLLCSADHEEDWQPYPIGLNYAICEDHTIDTYVHKHTLITIQPSVDKL